MLMTKRTDTLHCSTTQATYKHFQFNSFELFSLTQTPCPRGIIRVQPNPIHPPITNLPLPTLYNLPSHRSFSLSSLTMLPIRAIRSAVILLRAAGDILPGSVETAAGASK